MESIANAVHREPWNKGKIVGQKAPFKLKDIWALRVTGHRADRSDWTCLVRATAAFERSEPELPDPKLSLAPFVSAPQAEGQTYKGTKASAHEHGMSAAPAPA